MKKVIILGGGPAGCAAAHQIGMLDGYDVTIIEKTSLIGGGCLTKFFGGHPYTFGPRHFLTDKPYLYEFLKKYVPMRSCGEHEFKTYIESEDEFYNYPLIETDIQRMPDVDKITEERKNAKGAEGQKNLQDYWLNTVGPTLFKKFIHDYNKKMWHIDDLTEIDDFAWAPRGPSIGSGKEKVFSDRISAYPTNYNGYNDYFPIATEKAKVLLNYKLDKFDILKKEFVIDGDKKKFDIVVNTLSPDFLFNYELGELPYSGIDFHPFVLPIENAFPKDVYFLYYATLKNKIKRCVEYKKLTRYKSKNTLLGIEVPSLNNKLYPLPVKKHKDLASRYHDLMPEGVYSIGRAGVYKYGIDFDRCIDHGMIVAKDLKSTGGGKGSVLKIDPSGEQHRVAK
tara:strand:+ start:462 stop:1643 length:1182 start_codon:yes stop_codon:yes gene_type:complete